MGDLPTADLLRRTDALVRVGTFEAYMLADMLKATQGEEPLWPAFKDENKWYHWPVDNFEDVGDTFMMFFMRHSSLIVAPESMFNEGKGQGAA